MVKTLHFQFLQRVLEANLTLESLPEILSMISYPEIEMNDRHKISCVKHKTASCYKI